MIEVKNLSHSLGEKEVLRDVSLTLESGSVMGLVGINGAGKSTLLRLIAGVYAPDKGCVLCDGVSTQNAAARREIFFLPDDPYYTVYTTAQSLWRMYRVFYPHMDRAVWRQCLQEFGLDERKPIRNFSKGMKRQLYVALALSARPKYLLLDEAFDGLDPLARLRFKKAINRAVEEDGTSVLISSHSLRELEDFCDSYALIDHMTVSDSGSLSEHLGQFCKFQLAFAEPVERVFFAALPVVSLETGGRFVRVILKGDKTEMTRALERLSPVIMEEMPMDFEELFISEVGERGILP
ncbi:MAG: ABC transporter ATP-binding protein [Clostridia bacterium]|nr:ABC transporter ATP-binding protein [Clostridia bacterium]